ncbi:MAG: bacillithiol system redox-active protein YtxJ [Candidatus Cyclonatronum sp.]|uniref:bacillithiol system redox-active protein YtxJ n=1 Tax=Cyclonatronum sp. TaxID=3024185 RepID=UPI0025C15E47|nr:bacillithiol system redox-active protein YtxJ [Cyclonatronum sp.]MCC5934934.1 bacillithiol system redox-active protein YtxJ [Balneolales bacterium]MCH8487625.1 bacillithiol system redox-active protein YtxJ [Cyclonatronum sp.]
MSFLDRFKSFSAAPAVSDKWQRFEKPEAADPLFQESARPALIYKHSFACSICTYSLMSLERSLEQIMPHADVYFVDVRAERPVSNYIAGKSGVIHQSPQAILLYKGKAYWHGSHGEVRAEPVLDSLNEIADS